MQILKRLLNALWKRGIGGSGNAAQTAAAHDALEGARARLAAGDEEGASRLIDEALRASPDSAHVWNDAGILRLRLRDHSAAKTCFERALQLSSELAEAHANLAITLLEQGHRADGVRHLNQAIVLAPKMVASRENLAALLMRELSPVAMQAWNDVLELEPDHAKAHAAKAFLLLRQGRIDEARELYARARALGLQAADTGLEEAAIRAWQGDFQGARAQAEALRGQVDDADIDWQLAMTYLAAGDFAEGWPRYEARLRRTFESPRRAYGYPEWDGSRLDGGMLLIMGEQGLGDEIMFASCYNDAHERAGRCIIECEPRLAHLFERSFPRAQVLGHARDGVHPALAADERITCQIHAGSLPKFFRLDVRSFPRHEGYLEADQARIEHWRHRLRQDRGHRLIGIAWSGGLSHTRRAIRSIPIAEFASLLRIPNAEFVSLQHDDPGDEARALARAAGVRVHAFPEALQDVDDTAALVSALDAVASVCCAVVHLAGALAIPTLALTPRVAEWRYLAKGDSMPWYPAVRLIRQSASGHWTEVIEDARAHLVSFE